MYDKYVKDIMYLYDKEQDEYDKLDESDPSHEKVEEEIAEKYDKLILDVNKKYNIIFRYDLADAWGVQLSTLIITSDKKNNVVCVYDNEGFNKELENAYFTVDSKKIEEILIKYEDKIKRINDMEENNSISINDGVENSFYFNINGNVYSYTIFNLLARYADMKEKVELFSDLLTEIREVLVKDVKHIDRCLTLG